MSAAGYKVSANYVEASVLSRPAPSPDCMKCTKAADGYCLGKEEGAAQAREKVLDIFDEFLNSDDHLTLYKWEVREKIRTLRTGGERR
jgi:hypothetical protein